MAVRSMTGFGRGSAAAGGVDVEVELSSVNRKQLDIRITMPRGFTAYETLANDVVKASIPRGSVSGVIRVNMSESGLKNSLVVDAGLAENCVGELRKVARKLGLKDDLGARVLLSIPEVVRLRNVAEDTSTVWPLMKKALLAAVKNLVKMKDTEGQALGVEIRTRLAGLKELLAAIRKLAPEIPERHRKTLLERLSRAGLSLGAADEQVVREVAMFADRCDICEEVARLDSHFAQAAGMLSAKEPSGRPLDFLCQEMFREINTIGSKANSAEISALVVKFKAMLETVREQVQNVE